MAVVTIILGQSAGWTGRPGHAAVQVQIGNNIVSAGFGPKESRGPYALGDYSIFERSMGDLLPSGYVGSYADMSGNHYKSSHSYSFTVSDQDAVNAVAAMHQYESAWPSYNIFNHAICSDFARTSLGAAGISIPNLLWPKDLDGWMSRHYVQDYLGPGTGGNTPIEISGAMFGTTTTQVVQGDDIVTTVSNGNGQVIAQEIDSTTENFSVLSVYGYTGASVQYLQSQTTIVPNGTVIHTGSQVPNSATADVSIEVPNTPMTVAGPGSAGPTPQPTPTTTITGAAIGSIFGSSIGQALAGQNAFTRVAAGSMLSTALGTVGSAFDLYFNDTSGNLSLEGAVAQSLNSLGANLGSTLASQATSALSGYLVGEFYKMLGVNTSSTGGQLLTIASNTVVNQLISNITHGAALSTGFNGTMITNMAGAIGGSLTMRPDNDNDNAQIEIAA
jgi:hypothetical protein